ncbi:IS66 family transposase [Paraburkholderia sp. 32]|uniref:IS66 family transposase n=1 Tax=Paraburkholderia sp. 32 TaxID=2991057 RepID=UPI003D1C602B
MYAIEPAIRGKPRTCEDVSVRSRRGPLLDALETWLRSTLSHISQKGDTAKAINYALNQWPALTMYVDEGIVEIDNHAAERALRAVEQERKGGFIRSSQSLIMLVFMGRPAGWMHKLTRRGAMRSSGAPSRRREIERRLWKQFARDITNAKAEDLFSRIQFDLVRLSELQGDERCGSSR